MERFSIPFDPGLYNTMRFAAQRRSWLQRAARARDPDAAARVFDGDRGDGYAELATLAPEVGAEVRRLLPWAVGRVRQPPSVALYASRDGILMVDARNPDYVEAAERVARIAADVLAEHYRQDHPVVRVEHLPMAVHRTSGTMYRAVRFRTDAEDPVDTDEDAVRRLIYDGLVGTLLREPKALDLLGALPEARDAGLYVDAMPIPDLRQRFAGKTQHHGFVFSLDVDIEGPWAIGGGILFGFGAVFRNKAWEAHAIMRQARFSA